MKFGRISIAALALSAAGFGSIIMSEGYEPVAKAPVKGDVPTVGFGSTGPDIKNGDKIDPVRAVQRALGDIAKFEGAIKQCVKVPLHQYEYDAYLELSYNIGSGAFCNSTLVRKLNAEDYKGACEQILVWDKFKGAPLKGLTIRRQREYQTCIGS